MLPEHQFFARNNLSLFASGINSIYANGYIDQFLMLTIPINFSSCSAIY